MGVTSSYVLFVVYSHLQAVLVLCRGLFTPGHNDAASRVHDNVHGAALRQHAGGSSLVDSFGQVPAMASIFSSLIGPQLGHPDEYKILGLLLLLRPKCHPIALVTAVPAGSLISPERLNPLPRSRDLMNVKDIEYLAFKRSLYILQSICVCFTLLSSVHQPASMVVYGYAIGSVMGDLSQYKTYISDRA